MCYLETHSCVCTEAWRRKIVHRRAIACPPDVNCQTRNLCGPNPNFWPATYIKECADFHKGPAPAVPYVCPIDRLDQINGSADFPEHQKESEILRFIDLDYVTFHDHLDKEYPESGTDFSETSLSTGDVDTGEFIDTRYSTGWMYNRLPDGTLVQMSNRHHPRGRTEGYDPSDMPEPLARKLANAEWDLLIESDEAEDGEEAAVTEPDTDAEVRTVQDGGTEISNTRSKTPCIIAKATSHQKLQSS